MKKTNFTFLKKQPIKSLLLSCLFLLTLAQFASGQCALACNGTTNVSLDNASCQAVVTVGMVADVSGCPNGDFEVTIIDALGNELPNATITSDYVGQTLEVHVTDVSSNNPNSCWGFLVVEDKLPPTIECPDPTGPVYCYTVDDYMPIANDNCGVAEIILIDSTEVINDCNSGYDEEVIKIITKTYIAVDEQGLESDPCTVEMEVLRIDSLGLIQGPKNLLWVTDNALECDGVYPLDAQGHPSPIELDSLPGVPGTGVPTLDGVDLYPNPYSICNILVTYSDVELFPGGCVEKIMRTWQVIEWSCSNPQRTYDYVQMIEIVDTVGPTIVCPGPISATTNTHDCSAIVLLPPATLSDNCSTNDEISVNITYQGAPLMNTNGGLAALDLGTTYVTYTAYDKCGNSSQCDVEVTVEDNTPPVTVCDQYTTVALTSDGYAWVHASVFDDGSYDECSLQSLTVKRMDDGVPCDNLDDDVFDEYVRFCCLDQGDDVMVILRATDASGNVNDCMVNVTVQDKLAPTIVCPSHMTVNCDFAYEEDNLEQYFGEYFVIDNCENVEANDVLSGTLNQCNIGTLTRTISVGEPGTQNYDECVQFITFQPLDAFYINEDNPNDPNDDVEWPADVSMEGCSDPTSPAYLPENLPIGSQYPTFYEGVCDLVAANYDDQIFPFNNQQGDACFKIVRTWTVIDWCQFETTNTGATTYPEWEYVQIIKINDPEAPIITSSCERVTTCTYDADCLDGPIELIATATDSCTNVLKWYYQIDANNDGSFEPGLSDEGFGNTINASGTYPVGSHRIVYSFEDKCGNVTSCEQLFDIVNCKAPTPYCLNGLAVDLMPIDEDGDGEIDGGSVVLWATDFDAGSFHTCYDDVYLSFDPVFFSETGNTTLPNGLKIEVNNGKEFTCETLGDQSVDIYAAIVTPEDSIIQAYCTTFVNVQDNMGACAQKPVIEGGISTAYDVNLENAEVELIGSELEIVTTDASGHYAFPSMPYGGQYIVNPVKNDDYTNGVSTLDLVMIQRHILGIEALDSPYKMIAADINKDEKIAASDLLVLRKLILGTISELPDVGSWRFIDAEFEFADPSNVFSAPFPENYNIATLNSSMNIDFIALKVGDVNNNAIANVLQSTIENRSDNAVSLTVDNQEFNAGDLIAVPVTVNNDMYATGMQFTVEVRKGLEFAGLSGKAIDIFDYNVGYSQLSEGLVTISWNNPEGIALQADEELFDINFSANTDGELAGNIEINSTMIPAEMYNDQLETFAIDFSIEGREIQNTAFALHQNTPNPFGQSTTISFDLPESLNGTLTVFDLTGKMVARIQKQFDRGFNQVTLDRAQLGASGLMYYQLEAGQYFASKKMIMID